MNILIVGGGVVGTATGLAFARLGHSVDVSDPALGNCLAGTRGLPVAGMLALRMPDVVFICVPETALDDAARQVRDDLKADPPVYIRSSVPPGTCLRLARDLGRHFGHAPEFLREAVYEYDALNPTGIILGDCCPNHADMIENLFQPFRVPIHHTDPTTSELTKLAVNSHLACLISYWGQIKSLADRLGVNSHEVGMLASHCDKRVSTYGARFHGFGGYGGRCLPKDLQQMLDLCRQQRVEAPLLTAIKVVNDRLQAAEKGQITS